MTKNKKIIDYSGNTILLGMYLLDLNCKFLTYQVRIRDKKLVLHTGASYTILTQNRANNLKILAKTPINILGDGFNIFNTNLIN